MITDNEQYEDYQEQILFIDRAIRKAHVCIRELRSWGEGSLMQLSFEYYRYKLNECRALYTQEAKALAAIIENETSTRVDKGLIDTCELGPYSEKRSRYDRMPRKDAHRAALRMFDQMENESVTNVYLLFGKMVKNAPYLEVLAGERGL